MTPEHRRKFAAIIEGEKGTILGEWVNRTHPLLSASNLDTPQIIDQMPRLLEELVHRIQDIDRPHSWLEGIHTEEAIETTAMEHGRQRFRVGFDIVEVVKEFGILQEVIYDVAESKELVIGGKGSQVFHFVFNKALAAAAYSYQREKEAEIRQRRKEYLSFVMHDLKTPLNAILVASQMIEEQVDDEQPIAEINGIILRSGERLNELLQKTITVAKTTDPEDTEDLVPEHFELWPVVQSVIDEFKVVASVDKTIIHNLVSPALSIVADLSAMKSVFRNLISNALKYNPGGKVVIGVTTTTKDRIDIWVRDNGGGMPQERLDQLFTKISPDPAHEGSTGLGLIMVKKIVEAHDGTVNVISKEGEGTTVSFSLPLTK